MNVLYQKNIPIRLETDVFVAGGGPAGIAAAMAASRCCAKVFLAESMGALGGMGVNALVPAFVQFTNGVDFLAGGVGREIHDRMLAAGARTSGWRTGDLMMPPEPLKRLYDRLLLDAGVDFSLFTTMIDAAVEDGRVTHVILSAKSGLFAVKAKVYIDCTGDADLCAMAGAPFEFGDEHGVAMPATLCSSWANVDWEKVTQADNRELERAIADGLFPVEDRHLPGMYRQSEHISGGNIGHAFRVDPTDERSLTKAIVESRKLIPTYEMYYKQYLTGYENMELSATGAALGVRESRRIVGDYVLTGEDFTNRASFPDEIGRYAYPVDIHIMAPDKASYDEYHRKFMEMRYKEGESYGIPYRCLLPKTLENVLTAGKCLSADRQMQASIRVMPGCFITGQAAGAAAALATDGDVRSLPVENLQRKLAEMGAFLPNF